MVLYQRLQVIILWFSTGANAVYITREMQTVSLIWINSPIVDHYAPLSVCGDPQLINTPECLVTPEGDGVGRLQGHWKVECIEWFNTVTFYRLIVQ